MNLIGQHTNDQFQGVYFFVEAFGELLFGCEQVADASMDVRQDTELRFVYMQSMRRDFSCCVLS